MTAFLAGLAIAVSGLLMWFRESGRRAEVKALEQKNEAQAAPLEAAIAYQKARLVSAEEERRKADAELDSYLSSHPDDSGTDGSSGS